MMEFVIWMLGYPLVSSIANTLSVLRRKQSGKEPFTDNVESIAGIVGAFVYIYVAVLLWGKA